MRRRLSLLAFMVFVSGCISSPDRRAGSDSADTAIPQLAVEKHQLANGMEVLLVETHRLPRVAVNLWYHVGPVNEEPGRTGFAHLFEHMMFQESKHIPADQHFRLLEAVGASDINGTTDFDRTNYFETVPSHQLEVALWLESDRMGYLLDQVNDRSLRNQQDVVRNERRQSVENRPFGIVEEAVFHNLFPKSHPYYGLVIGSHQDIQAAKLDDVRRFFRQYYSPNNASLAIVGDIDKAQTMKFVEKYFGSLKRGPDIPPVQGTTPPITAERRLEVKDRVELPRLYMAWLTPPIFKPGDAEATVAARILGEGKSSRLYRKLVYEKQIAQDVNAYQSSNTLTSMFVVQVTARADHNLEEIEKEMDTQLATLRRQAPDSAEIDRAKAAIETQTLLSLERIGGFDGIADRINLYNHHLKNPDYLSEDIQRFRRVSAAQLQQFARQYLVNTARVVVRGVAGEPDFGPSLPTPTNAAETKAQTESVNADEEWRRQHPIAGTPPALKLPTPRSFTLSNGLTVIVDERKGIPVVSANLTFRSGSRANPVEKPGLASLTVEMLDEGTASRTTVQFADQLAQIGARLRSSASFDSASLVLTVMKKNFTAGLDLLADAVVNPTFPQNEIDRQRDDRIGRLLQLKEDPAQVAARVLALAIFGPKNPYGYMEIGTEAALRSMKREELQEFWSEHIVPNNAALIVAGDTSENELRPLLEKAFSNWKQASPKLLAEVSAEPASARLIIVDKPGAPQTQLRVALPGPPRLTPDYESLLVMNGILGGGFSSRINMNLREEHGYSYGAGSGFTHMREGGWFSAGSGVRTDVTAPALREVMREIVRMNQTLPTSDELQLVKERLVGALPPRFETSEQTVGALAEVYIYDLGPDYYTTLAKKVSDVSAQTVQQVARKYLIPERLLVVAVGDRKRIESELRRMNLGQTEIRNAEGVVIPRC